MDRPFLNLVRDIPRIPEDSRNLEDIGTWVIKLIIPPVPSVPNAPNRIVRCYLVSLRREFPLMDLIHEHGVLAINGTPYDPAYPSELLLSPHRLQDTS